MLVMIPVVTSFRRQKQNGLESVTTLEYIMRTCLKNWTKGPGCGGTYFSHFLGGRGRRTKRSKSSLAVGWVEGQPVLPVALPLNE